MLQKFAPLIVHNLARNRRRTVATALSIAISLFIFSTAMSLPQALDALLADRADTLRLITHSRSGPLYPIPEAYGRRIESAPHVEQTMAFTLFAGIYHLPTDQFPNFAVDPAAIEDMWPDWGISPLAANDFRKIRTSCLAGEALMRRFGWRIGQQIILRGTVYPVNLQLNIVGTLSNKAPPVALLFRRDYLEEVLGRKGNVNVFWVRVDRSESIPTAIESIDRLFANSSSETQTESEAAFFTVTTGLFRSVMGLAKVVAMVVIATIGLVAANTAAMSTRERRSEIAIMRAIGFARGQILGCIVAEGVAIGLVGGALGCGAAWGALRIVRLGSGALGPLAFALKVSAAVVAQSLSISAALGAVASLVPALSATRRTVVDALRAIT